MRKMTETINMYQGGKIYKITDNSYSKCYIGSTCQSLSRRLSGHKADYARWLKGKHNSVSVFNLFEMFGTENCKIELIEICPCDTKEELLKKEGCVIQSCDCVNKIIAGRTPRERNLFNKDKIKTRHQAYWEKNREHLMSLHKDWLERNKDSVNFKKCERIPCLNCSRLVTRDGMARHLKTMVCIEKVPMESVKKRETIACPICESPISKYGLDRHQRTQKCKAYHSN